MNIVFFGSTELARDILEILINKLNVLALCCHPDSKKGRGRKLTPCATKEYALSRGLKILDPINVNNPENINKLKKINADAIVLIAYGQILKKEILSIYKYGALNIHPSILPRWRGAAPIQRAILNNDKKTAVSILQMEEGLDSGAILYEKEIKISSDDTSYTLSKKLVKPSAKAIIEVVNNIDNITPRAQAEKGLSYANKISKQESWVDWHKSAVDIDCMIRSFNPYPIAQTYADTTKIKKVILKIIKSKVINKDSNEKPGTILSQDKNGVDIATKKGIIKLIQVQLPGKNPVFIKDFINAYKLEKLY